MRVVEEAGLRRGTGFLLGIVVTLAALFGGGWLYLKFGDPPVAAADPSFPFEAQIVHVPLHARIERDLQTAPFPVSEPVMLAGAQVYAAECSQCHGVPGKDVAFAKWMYPSAPQLWKAHHGHVGVSDDPAGESYWKVKNGIRLAGMPAYQHILSTEQMWDVSLLVANADKPLSPAVQTALNGK